MRKLLGMVVVAVATTMLGSVAPVGAQAVVSHLSITGSPLRAGESFQVAGDSCIGGTTVLIGMLDAESESALASAAVAPDEGGAWSATLTVPATTRPGTYPVTARCADYSGYDGYNGDGDDGGDGYNGDGPYNGYNGYNGTSVDAEGAGVTYVTGQVVVLPPLTPPAADGALTVTPNVVERGRSVVISGRGWGAGEQVTVTLYSTPVVLASVRADAAGAITLETTIAADTPLGAHTVVAMNATSALHPALTLSAPLTVIERGTSTSTSTTVVQPGPTASTPGPQPQVLGTSVERPSSLPFTGSSAAGLAFLGALLVATGALARRRARSAARPNA